MTNYKSIKTLAAITILFTLLDWMVHNFELLPKIVPDYYFIFKLIALPVFIYLIVRYIPKLSNDKWLFSIILAALLQIRYFYMNIYGGVQNLEFIGVHYVLIYMTLWIQANYLEGKL